MDITVINMSNGEVRAHRTGCRDIERESRGHNDNLGSFGEFASQDDLVADYNADFDKETDGWYDVDFAPCVSLPQSGE